MAAKFYAKNKKVVIGSRGSHLALAQSQGVLKELSGLFPDAKFELKVIKTKGDMMIGKPLSQIGGKGLFVKEIEQAMLRGEIDLAVHSLKDLPTEMPKRLTLGAIPKREDPRDALLTPSSLRSDTPLHRRWRGGVVQGQRVRRIGTSSLRRKAQLLAKWPEVEVVDIRGNLDTRIRKLNEENLDAIVVAMAGVRRLKVDSRALNVELRKLSWMLPAPGQGALAIECRKDDTDVLSMLAKLNHRPTQLAVTAERALLFHLGGGCLVPIGAHATIRGEKMKLEGIVAEVNGGEVVRGVGYGVSGEPEIIGKKLAKKLLKMGAGKLLK